MNSHESISGGLSSEQQQVLANMMPIFIESGLANKYQQSLDKLNDFWKREFSKVKNPYLISLDTFASETRNDSIRAELPFAVARIRNTEQSKTADSYTMLAIVKVNPDSGQVYGNNFINTINVVVGYIYSNGERHPAEEMFEDDVSFTEEDLMLVENILNIQDQANLKLYID